MRPTLVVMAAGMGSRYGGLKQIDPVGPRGEIILDYSLYDARRAGFGKVVFVVKEETAELFRATIGRRVEGHLETAYVCQRLDDLPAGFAAPEGREKPWGTAHAVYAARAEVSGTFAVINADDFYGPSSYRLLAAHLDRIMEESHEYCLVGYVLANTLTENGSVSRGVCRVDEDGYLREIREHTRIERRDGRIVSAPDGGTGTELPADSTVSMNMWGFTPRVLREIEARFPEFLRANAANLMRAEFFLPDLVMALLTEGKARVKVLRTGERWFGVTYRQDKPAVAAAVARLAEAGVYPADLWPRQR
ncbi:MAG: sugar phosphate nucleotidyltransferase [Bacteroidota bacterium]